MSIVFPGDLQNGYPDRSYTGLGSSIGGVEKYGVVNGSSVSVTNLSASNISTGTLSADRIASGSLDAKIASIEWAKIANVSIATAQIQDAAITSAKIYSVEASKISAGTLSGFTINGTHINVTGGDSTLYFYDGATYRGAIFGDNTNTGILISGTPDVNIFPQGGRVYITGSTQISNNMSASGWIKSSSKKFYADSKEIEYQGTGKHWVADDHITLGNGKNLNLNQDLTTYNTTSFYLSGGTPKLSIGGVEKTAIVPTSKGYNALYCTESPEVWFWDFAKVVKPKWWKFWEKPTYVIDPLFLETVTGPFVPLPTLVPGWVQIYAKRKGHEGKRFESKTKEEFERNNKFWSQEPMNPAKSV